MSHYSTKQLKLNILIKAIKFASFIRSLNIATNINSKIH